MSLNNIPTCYATPSAGMHKNHTLPMKLKAIAKAKFPYAELSFPEIDTYTKQVFEERGQSYENIDEAGKGDIDKLVETGKMIKGLCDELGIKILAVHPFSKFEGYTDPEKTKAGLLRAKAMFKLLNALDCQMMQVGSTNENKHEITSSFEKMAEDLRQLADVAAEQSPPIKIAYEMWAWGTFVNSWKDTWDICQRVNRDNFGLCLDTFQICAREFADPTAPSGLISSTETFHASMEKLSKTIHPSKIFYLQISDGARVDHKSFKGDAENEKIHPLYLWSNKYRPLPYSRPEWRGYLPVLDVVKAVLKTGWRGPWSYEVFFEEDQKRGDLDVPERWTKEASECHQKILQELRASEGEICEVLH